jgi:methylated-DNA-protein-cysteine methyltransferase-like protein
VSDSYARIYTVVAAIPAGKVCSYGQVAEMAEMPRAARQVGYALAALRGKQHQIPWWRVLNAKGEVSVRNEAGERENLQQTLLEAEGVEFDLRGRVDLGVYRWLP